MRLGCTYIQIDAPQYAALLDPALREGYRQRGSDPDRLIDACIEMDNAVDRRAIRASRSACTSAAATTSRSSTPAAATSPSRACSARSRFQRFLLEYDDERSGGFEPLRAVPEDRRGAGAGDARKKPRAGVGRRAAQAHRRGRAAIVPLDRLALSPQCGFASTMEGNRSTPEEQRREAPARGRDGARRLGRVTGALDDRTLDGGHSMRLLTLLVLALASPWAGTGPGAGRSRSARWCRSPAATAPAAPRCAPGYEIAVEQINAGRRRHRRRQEDAARAGAARRRVGRHQDRRAGWRRWPPRAWSPTSAASAPTCTRPPPRWPRRTRSPYLGIAFALNKIHQQGFKLPLLAVLEVARHRQAHARACWPLIPAAERPKTVAIFQEKTDWGQEMARRVDRGRQGRRLPGRGARRVRAGRQGLLRPHPQGQGGQRRRRVRAFPRRPTA